MSIKGNRISLLSIVILLFMIGVWIYKIVHDEMPYVDQWTRGIVEASADTPIYTVFRWITELGSESFVLPFTLIMLAVLWFIFKDWLPALTFGLGVLGSHLLNLFIKKLVARDRPSISELLNAEGHSFPSGHSMVSMVCYGVLAFLISKKLKSSKVVFIQYFFALLIFLIGISRFFINVHYLTDILTGFVLGFIILILLMHVFDKIQKKRTQSSGGEKNIL